MTTREEIAAVLRETEWAIRKWRNDMTATELAQTIFDTPELTKLLARLSIEPDGWRLVPVEPTQKMLSAGLAAWLEIVELDDDYPVTRPIWLAMLAAAPKPEPGTTQSEPWPTRTDPELPTIKWTEPPAGWLEKEVGATSEAVCGTCADAGDTMAPVPDCIGRAPDMPDEAVERATEAFVKAIGTYVKLSRGYWPDDRAKLREGIRAALAASAPTRRDCDAGREHRSRRPNG